MDAIDEEILGILRDDARISFGALGSSVGLSANAAAARVRRLERDGVILGYTIRTETELRPDGLEVYIDATLDDAADYEEFLAAVGAIPAIVDAVHMTGGYDYLLHAYLRDVGALDGLLRRLKKDCGVAQTQTRIALRR